MATEDADLIARLGEHRMLGGAPRGELAWLASRGTLRPYAVGDVVFRKALPTAEMFVVLDGHVVQYVDRGSGPRKFMEWRGGEVTGVLPYSRMVSPPGDSVVEAPTEVLAIRRELFPELIRACPTVTATLVHVMLDRARDFTSNHFQDEKTMSLGRLAAGIAHELNNPASAAARGAQRLREALAQATRASSALGAARLTESQQARLDVLRLVTQTPGTSTLSAMERADLEEEVATWLAAYHANIDSAPALAENGVRVEALDALAESLGDALHAALDSLAAEFTVQSLVSDVERATARIHGLVSAVKRFTNMDRATVAVPTDIAQSLADTIAVMASRAREKSVAIRLELRTELPRVRGHAAELTQVWSNLIDNALDAVGASGGVVVTAAREGDDVVVRITDDGPGIATDIQARIFDPFFTTKPVGEGTGLGLDIARRIVRLHSGQIDVESRPGRTEFRVALPVATHEEAATRLR